MHSVGRKHCLRTHHASTRKRQSNDPVAVSTLRRQVAARMFVKTFPRLWDGIVGMVETEVQA